MKYLAFGVAFSCLILRVFAPTCTFRVTALKTVIPKYMSCLYPSTRVLFDRKHVATKSKAGLVQIEVLFGRKRKMISTGVKVFLGEWNERAHVINRPDQYTLNQRIDEAKLRIDTYINGLIKEGKQFDFDTFSRWLEAGEQNASNFIDWIARRIEERAIAYNTRRSQRKMLGVLREFGLIVSFDELTRANILRFDDWLHAKGFKQSTIYDYHAVMKVYIRDAIKRELLEHNPYDGLKFARGKTEWGKYVTLEELDKLEKATMPTKVIDNARDLFLFQCYTGLAYSDLMAFDFARVYTNEYGQFVYNVERVKTGVPFVSILLPKAMAILDKHNKKLPHLSNTLYNAYLKAVALAAGVDKPLATHYGRRTCGMLLLLIAVDVSGYGLGILYTECLALKNFRVKVGIGHIGKIGHIAQGCHWRYNIPKRGKNILWAPSVYLPVGVCHLFTDALCQLCSKMVSVLGHILRIPTCVHSIFLPNHQILRVITTPRTSMMIAPAAYFPMVI